jgi:hypothetical protein
MNPRSRSIFIKMVKREVTWDLPFTDRIWRDIVWVVFFFRCGLFLRLSGRCSANSFQRNRSLIQAREGLAD